MPVHSFCFEVWTLEAEAQLLRGERSSFWQLESLWSSGDGAADRRAVQSCQRDWSGALSAACAGVPEKRFLQRPATQDSSVLGYPQITQGRALQGVACMPCGQKLLCCCCDVDNDTVLRYCLKWYFWLAVPWRLRENPCARGEKFFFSVQSMSQVTWNAPIVIWAVVTKWILTCKTQSTLSGGIVCI